MSKRLSIRAWLSLAAVEVVLFFVANMTAKNSAHPGTVSNIAWGLFLVGIVALLIVGVASALRARRTTS